MSYEKYIKKDGKIYGPYIYHSKRVDGKVVSEYHGQVTDGNGKNNKILWIIFTAVLIVAAAYFISQKSETTGYSVLGINPDYEENELLSGNLNLQLREGEFIPAGSTIVIKNSDEQKNYPLTEIITEQSEEGNFFISGKNISGSGIGFGVKGTREIAPEINFTLLIYTTINSTEGIESERELEGIVSAKKEFSYELQEGERAELKPKSVFSESNSNLNDNDISIQTSNGSVSVTTSYTEKEKGFGEEYLGENTRNININLGKLNISPAAGELSVSVIYDGEIIASTSTTLGTEETEKKIENEAQNNQEEVITNNTIPKTNFGLSVEEESALIKEFGTSSVALTEATSKNEFITVRLELGNFWIENSYSKELSDETLQDFIDQDKAKFLKDVAQNLLTTEPVEKPVTLPQ